MSNDTPHMAPMTNLEVLKRVEAGELTPEEGLQQLQSQGQNVETVNTIKGKMLKVLVFEGDFEQPKVSVTLPLGLAKWAGKLIPQFVKLGPLALDLTMINKAKSAEVAKLMQEKYTNLDLDTTIKTITEIIEEGFDELEEIGPFDLVTVQDDNNRVRICIE